MLTAAFRALPGQGAVVRIVALDSAERSGFAVLADGRLERHGVVMVRTAEDVARVAADLAACRPDVVAIEEPFSHPKFPATGLVLARLLGRWLQAFEAQGLTTVTVPASLWQPAVLPGVSSRTRSTERKAAAVTLARTRFGVDVGEDAADAIGLALYVAEHATRRAA